MEDIQEAEVTLVDRWTIDAESQKKVSGGQRGRMRIESLDLPSLI